MADGQAQVGDGAGAVLLHQDVLGLQVPVSDAGLSCANRRRFQESGAPIIDSTPLPPSWRLNTFPTGSAVL